MNQKQLEVAARRMWADESLEPQRKAYLLHGLMASSYIVAQQRVQQQLPGTPPAPSRSPAPLASPIMMPCVAFLAVHTTSAVCPPPPHSPPPPPLLPPSRPHVSLLLSFGSIHSSCCFSILVMSASPSSDMSGLDWPSICKRLPADRRWRFAGCNQLDVDPVDSQSCC